MANTSLPSPVSASPTGHLDYHTQLHREVNELSRNTGLRNVTDLLVNGWTATTVYIERVRDRVYLYVRGLDGSAATSAAFLSFSDLGTGFRPLGNSFQSPLMEDASGNSVRLRADANNVMGPLGVDIGGYNREFSWRSTASFPAESTWPGTAV